MYFLTASALFLVAWQAGSKVGTNVAENEAPAVSLTVASQVPLRLYLTKRIPKRLGATVEGKIMESVFAFDREVLPVGSAVTGRVTAVHPVNKWQRVRAIVGGDFTPLRNARVEFDCVILSDGTKLPLHTAETIGLNSIYIEPSRKKHGAAPKSSNGGTRGAAKQTVKDRIQDAIYARRGGVMDSLRRPSKKE